MAFDPHANFAYGTVLTAPSPASSGTSVVLNSGQGALFPSVSFNATIWPAGVQPTSTNAEIVRVTAISTDTFTITRAQESSSARTVIVGDQIAATITKKTLTDVEASSNGINSATTVVNTSAATAPSSGQILTATASTTATWQAPAAATSTKITVSSLYESSVRQRTSVFGSAANTYPTAGAVTSLTIDTVSGATSAGYVGWTPLVAGFTQGREASMGMIIRLSTVGSDCESFFGMCPAGMRNMTAGNLIDYTTPHAGFKITWASSGTISLYATNGQTAETASSALTTVVVNDRIELFVQFHGTTSLTSIDYYWRINDGALSSATNQTTNLPTQNLDEVAAMVGNKNVNNGNMFTVAGAFYAR